MKFFTKKGLGFKLISVICLFILMFNCFIPSISIADDEGETESTTEWTFNKDKDKAQEPSIGGKLLTPVVDLIMALGDAIVSVIQKSIMGTSSDITIDTGKKVLHFLLGVVLAIAAIGLALTVVGGLIEALAGISIALATAAVTAVTLAVGGGTFLIAYSTLNGAFIKEPTLIPTYSISPEEICRGDVLLFDVNIFNPKQVYVQLTEAPDGIEADNARKDSLATSGVQKINQNGPIKFETSTNGGEGSSGGSIGDVGGDEEEGKITVNTSKFSDTDKLEIYNDETDNWETVTTSRTIKTDTFRWNGVTYEYTDGSAPYKNMWVIKNNDGSKKTIFDFSKRKDFFPQSNASTGGDDSEYEGFGSDDDESGGESSSGGSTGTLTDGEDMDHPITIEEYEEHKEDYSHYKVKYYFYVKDGADINNEDDRIITSQNNSAAALKNVMAKWYYTLRNIAVVALMIVLLYIGIRMVLSSVAADKAKYKEMMRDWFVAVCLIFVMQYIMVFANFFTESIVDLLSSVSKKNQHAVIIEKPSDNLKEGLEKAGLKEYVQGDRVIILTNLMGKVRLLAQEQSGTLLYIGYGMCFLVLVWFTIWFVVIYLKRLIWMMFLTVISPLIAISYPIDKIGDGKSQAFDTWLREYIFNLVIQPFHLLLYVVFISTAFDLAGVSIIYSMIVLGFMMTAEKFLRSMFGFDKAKTPPFLGGAAGAAITFKALQGIGNIANGGKKAVSGAKDKLRMADGEKMGERGADKGKTRTGLYGLVAAGGSSEDGGPAGGDDSGRPKGPEDQGNPPDDGTGRPNDRDRNTGFGTDEGAGGPNDRDQDNSTSDDSNTDNINPEDNMQGEFFDEDNPDDIRFVDDYDDDFDEYDDFDDFDDYENEYINGESSGIRFFDREDQLRDEIDKAENGEIIMTEAQLLSKRTELRRLHEANTLRQELRDYKNGRRQMSAAEYARKAERLKDLNQLIRFTGISLSTTKSPSNQRGNQLNRNNNSQLVRKKKLKSPTPVRPSDVVQRQKDARMHQLEKEFEQQRNGIRMMTPDEYENKNIELDRLRREKQAKIQRLQKELDDYRNGISYMTPDEYENKNVELDRLQRPYEASSSSSVSRHSSSSASRTRFSDRPISSSSERSESSSSQTYSSGTSTVVTSEEDTSPIRTSGSDSFEEDPIREDVSSSREEEEDKKYRFSRWVANTKPAKTYSKYANPGSALKTGAKIATGIAGAAVGASIGIASGEGMKGVGKYGVGGAYAGSKLGEGVSNKSIRAISKANEIHRKNQKARDPDAYKARMQRKMDNETREDSSLRRELDRKLKLKGDEREIDKAVEDYIQYNTWGVNDRDIIIKTMKAEAKDASGRKIGRADPTKIAAATIAVSTNSNKDLEDHMKRLNDVKGMTKDKSDPVKNIVRQVKDF